MYQKLLAALTGWTAGLLLIGGATVAVESGSLDESAAAGVTAPEPTGAETAAPAVTGPATTTPSSIPGRPESPTLLVWTAGGLPEGFSARIGEIPGVDRHTTVLGDLVRLVSSTDAAGTPVDTAPAPWAFPIDALAIDPVPFASFAPGADGAVLAALSPGELVLTETSARLRRVGVGGVLTFAPGVTLRVAGIVADTSGSGAEVLVHQLDAPGLGIDSARFVLLTTASRDSVRAAITGLVPASEHLAIRGAEQTPWLRHGDGVDPQMLVKEAFGEFLFQDGTGRDIVIDPGWLDANLVTEVVPILGEIRCHRLLVPLVRDAMAQLQATGNGGAVDPADFAGCQHGRRIAPGAGLSRHSWGIALDLNVDGDPRGDFATQPPVLVDAFRTRGFRWGGDWAEYPDPAHYELTVPARS